MVQGSLRPATENDLDLLEQWTSAFHAEALPESLPGLRKRIERRVSLGEIFLWEDAEPRSMAGSARPTRRGIAINNVYTPVEWRGRGYATSCVARLSEQLLERGMDYCVLYTDLAHHTSNSIYTRIGYRPVADYVMMALTAGPNET
jgi:predicted GNAT family acetyltransferase